MIFYTFVGTWHAMCYYVTLKNILPDIMKKIILTLAVALATFSFAKAQDIETAAKGRGIIATKAATIAQAAFNAIAKANPYVLLATAIITVVGALAAFAIGSKKAKEQEEEMQRVRAAYRQIAGRHDKKYDCATEKGVAALARYFSARGFGPSMIRIGLALAKEEAVSKDQE